LARKLKKEKENTEEKIKRKGGKKKESI